jgi:cell division protein FtsI/penicillin-binding protein 2
MSAYGFGLPSGIALPNESRGIVHRREQWSQVSLAQIPMGHGLAVTRLQMVMAMSAMANQGWLMRPMLVNRLVDREGQVVVQYQPQRVRQVVSEAAARQMVQALKTVVSPEGTGPHAALTNYMVAGKTGTAQKTIEGVRGYAPGKYVSSFIGFFPADKPELCISIVLDEPKRGGYYGGVVAAPIFQQVAESVANYLHVPSDKPVAVPQPEGAPGDISGFRSLQTAAVNNPRTP